MNRLRERFDSARSAGRKLLVPYVTAGYPDVDATVEILRRLDSEHIGCVELGIPFSDPIADGPVIQTSFTRALEGGFKIQKLFDALAAARDEIRTPLVAMISYTLVYRRGAQEFITAAKAAGIDGLLAPDLAIEEAGELAELCRESDFPLVMMTAPTSGAERRKRIAALAEPWIYYQSLAGVTGERSSLPPNLPQEVASLRALTDKPICVGFGVSQPAHVKAVCEIADGAIVGSAIIHRMNDAIDRGATREEIAAAVVEFIDELMAPLKQ